MSNIYISYAPEDGQTTINLEIGAINTSTTQPPKARQPIAPTTRQATRPEAAADSLSERAIIADLCGVDALRHHPHQTIE